MRTQTIATLIENTFIEATWNSGEFPHIIDPEHDESADIEAVLRDEGGSTVLLSLTDGTRFRIEVLADG